MYYLEIPHHLFCLTPSSSIFIFVIYNYPYCIKKIPIAHSGGERIWTLESGKRVGIGNAQFSTCQTNKQTNTHTHSFVSSITSLVVPKGTVFF